MPSITSARAPFISLAPFILAMMVVVVSSNYLVNIPFDVLANVADEDWLTWGAFSYPVAFLVTDLSNRQLGAVQARRVVYIGFSLAVVLSWVLVDWRTAAASGTAFLVAQLLDVFLFSRLRDKLTWWAVPMVSSTIASILDTMLFFSVAFAGTGLPWIQLGMGDFGVKLLMALLLLLPYRALMSWTTPRMTAA